MTLLMDDVFTLYLGLVSGALFVAIGAFIGRPKE